MFVIRPAELVIGCQAVDDCGSVSAPSLAQGRVARGQAVMPFFDEGLQLISRGARIAALEGGDCAFEGCCQLAFFVPRQVRVSDELYPMFHMFYAFSSTALLIRDSWEP